jgi:hypothetical protein
MNHPLTAGLHRARRARVTQNSKLKIYCSRLTQEKAFRVYWVWELHG